MDEQKWKDVPWEDDLPAKTTMDFLVDVLSDIPMFLQEVMRYGNSSGLPTPPSSTPPPDYHALQGQILERLETMKVLYKNWLAEYPKAMWPTPSKPSQGNPLGGSQSAFETVFYFTDMYRAHDFCYYNATLILLIMIYEQVSHDLDPSLPCPSSILQTLFPGASLQNLIRDVCRSAEYLLLDIHGSRGHIGFLFPATVAYFASNRASVEAKWLYDICKRNAGSSGFGFGDFALDKVMPLSLCLDKCKRWFQSELLYPSAWTEFREPDNMFLVPSTIDLVEELHALSSSLTIEHDNAYPISPAADAVEGLETMPVLPSTEQRTGQAHDGNLLC